MANRFSQKFTLADIFNNPKLEGKIPLINYREKQLDNGKTSVRTSTKTITRLVYDISVNAARPFYKPLMPSRKGDSIVISGELKGDHSEATNAVFSALLAQTAAMRWTVNNADMVKSALKEGEKNRRRLGVTSKLYLRTGSMAQIEQMSKREIQALMTDIMENIFYSDDYPETKKKFKLTSLNLTPKGKSVRTYEQLKNNWKQKVGDS